MSILLLSSTELEKIKAQSRRVSWPLIGSLTINQNAGYPPRCRALKRKNLLKWLTGLQAGGHLKKIEKVKIKLGILMDQGFPVYMWQAGHVIPMEKHHLSTLHNQNIRKAMTLALIHRI